METSGEITTDLRFTDLPKVLPAGTQLWVNNTRVIRARLLLQKPTGGRLEVFLLEPHEMSMEQALASTQSVVWKCMVKGGKRWTAGEAGLNVEDAAGKWEVARQTRGHGRGCALHRIEVDRTVRRRLVKSVKRVSLSCWRPWAKCRCRLTCGAQRRSKTQKIIRRFMPKCPVQWRLRRQGCILMRR